ncbi:hypothetical protein CTI12_AA021300 [Artemisia annua]|uniref:Uncharacterized protein n=1 Tax=Artemisia annua TaxID=35608 RepID=A0A2U1QK40_ARTAN|nr:hypothetical protein CTI12_AA021300 [Artemisia annua]
MAILSTSFVGSLLDVNYVRCSLFGYESNVSSVSFSHKQMRLKMEVVARYKWTYDREKKLTEIMKTKMKKAREICDKNDGLDECKVAWDEVEEISQAKARLRDRLEHHQDPLEAFLRFVKVILSEMFMFIW